MPAAMTKLSANRRPNFFWQALLIVLPVTALGVIGVVSLRQDKLLAQHEAAERARIIADDLMPRIWGQLTATNRLNQAGDCCFQVDREGELAFPPPCAAIPVPNPFNLAELDPDQARLWLRAQQVESQEHDLESAVLVCRGFLDSKPPENFAAAARYGLGLLLAKQGNLQAAAQMFDLVLEKHPGAVGESGVPLRPLAQMQLLKLATLATNPVTLKNLVSLDSICSNAVYRPTPLTPLLLRISLERTNATRLKPGSQDWQRL